MFISPESLQLICFGILDDADSLVNRDTIVKGCGRCLHLNGAIGDNLRLLPAGFFLPVNAEHMVSKGASEHELRIVHRLDLAHINFFDLNVGSLPKAN